jgi:hypothetical protein
MPLLSFRPTRARLVIDEARESVLVMKMMLTKGESVVLATGGQLEKLVGVARIRERGHAEPLRSREIGALVFVPASGDGPGHEASKFQINISMAPKKFEALLTVALAGRLPSRFFLLAAETKARDEPKGMGYRVGAGTRTKFWDNRMFRSLPVSGFSMILPIVVGDAPLSAPINADGTRAELTASRDQVADMANDLSAFHGETKHLLIAVVSLFAVMAVLALLLNLVALFR